MAIVNFTAGGVTVSLEEPEPVDFQNVAGRLGKRIVALQATQEFIRKAKDGGASSYDNIAEKIESAYVSLETGYAKLLDIFYAALKQGNARIDGDVCNRENFDNAFSMASEKKVEASIAGILEYINLGVTEEEAKN